VIATMPPVRIWRFQIEGAREISGALIPDPPVNQLVYRGVNVKGTCELRGWECLKLPR